MAYSKTRALICAGLVLAVAVGSLGCNRGTDLSFSIDSDKAITVPQDKILHFALEGNMTTGYMWEIAGFGGSSVLRRMGKYEYKPDSNRIGSAGVQSFKFETKEKGDAKVIFEYRRPWEKDMQPAKRYTVKITVR